MRQSLHLPAFQIAASEQPAQRQWNMIINGNVACVNARARSPTCRIPKVQEQASSRLTPVTAACKGVSEYIAGRYMMETSVSNSAETVPILQSRSLLDNLNAG